MAILCADWKPMDLCADALHQRRLPFNARKRAGEYNAAAEAIQVMTMKVSKGLALPRGGGAQRGVHARQRRR